MGSSGAPMTPLPGEPAPGESGVPFDDVSLGGLLGKGSFGSVFYGWWNDTTVAIKVRGAPAEPSCHEPCERHSQAWFERASSLDFAKLLAQFCFLPKLLDAVGGLQGILLLDDVLVPS